MRVVLKCYSVVPVREWREKQWLPKVVNNRVLFWDGLIFKFFNYSQRICDWPVFCAVIWAVYFHRRFNEYWGFYLRYCMISILFYYLMSIKNCSKFTCSFTNCSFTNKSPPVPWQVSTAPGVGRTGGAPKGGRQKKLAGPPRILRGHERAKVRRPPKWKKSAAGPRTTAAGPREVRRFRGGRHLRRAPAGDRRRPPTEKLRQPTTADARRRPAVDRRSSAGVWTTAKKVNGPAARGPACGILPRPRPRSAILDLVWAKSSKGPPTPADARQIFCNFTCFWRARRGLPNLKIGGCRRAPAKYYHLRGRPQTLAVVSF